MKFYKRIVFAVSVVLMIGIPPFGSVSTARLNLTNKEDYIILTTKNLLKAATLFKNYRGNQYNVHIVTLSDIRSNKAKDIRLYLKKHFTNGYLLIIGSEKTIPRPVMYPSEKEHSVSFDGPGKTETDLYYGLLSENIDKDGDGFPGEFYDDDIKISPDLIVGRIPFDKESLVEKVFYDTVKFEKNSPSKAVLAASFISYPGEIYQGVKIFNGDGAREEELISRLLPVRTIKLYNKSGDFPSVYDATLPLNKDNFYSEITDAGFTDWVAHGSREAAYNDIWFDRNKNGIPDDGNEFKSFISAEDSFKANGIFFSGSCLNENGDLNLGIALLMKGAVSFIGSTEISFSPSYFAKSSDGGTGSINYYFVKNLVSGETVGKALYDSFRYFFNNFLFSDIEDPVEGSLMDIYDYNIYGDPALSWHFKVSKTQDHKNYGKSTVSLNVKSEKDIKITLNIPKKEDLFFMFPPNNLLITKISVPSAIIDNNFGIIRLNGVSGIVTICGRVRGNLNGLLKVKDDNGISARNIKVKGYDLRDFNFDGNVNETDTSIFYKNFGKTYMSPTFNKLCDLNFDHKTDGTDLFLFIKKGPA